MLTDRSRRALSLCSSLAIATALIVGSSAARAQSFQGNGTFASGTGTISTGTGTTTINLATTHVVIDWTTFDTAIGGGPIDFQPVGTTATFQRVGSDFSVLNRILPTDPSRAIQFNGNIIAQIQSTTNIPGGDVYFYSPGGVIVGSTAVFNVGNLGLTSIAPAVVGGQFVQGTGTEFVQFNGAVTPGSSVIVQTGAQITSSGANGSYVAIVAPMIDQRGTINVNTVAALVSADAATITFNPTGLFDIQVTSGTSSTGNAGNGRTLINTGTITGPAFSGTGPLHRAYLVAVPKNTAITMIIGDGTSLGFNIAGAADVVGNAVILSAGYDVVGGDVASIRSAGGGSGATAIDAFNAAFTSDVRGRATGRALFGSDGTVGAGATRFAAGVRMHSDTIVSLEARSGGPLSVVGNVFLDADNTATANGASATGGQAYLDARNGAGLTVGGSVSLSAVGTGAPSMSPGVLSTGNGTGGSASLNAITGGSIAITGNVGLDASGHAGFTEDFGVDGGNGTGGTVNVFVSGSGSSIGVGGNLSAFAFGFGGDGTGCTTCSDDGGVGQGGQILVQAASGPAQINITGNVDLDSSGFGGNSLSSLAGAGTGGRANIGSNVNSTITIGGFADVTADGFGGDDLALSGVGGGGAGTGGLAELGVFQGGTVDVASFISTSAVGFGGDSSSSGGPAGSGTGGIAQLYHDTAGSLIARSGVTLFADGFGGNAVGNAVAGGNGTGGQARAILYNAGTSSLAITGSISAFANGFGGAGLTAGGTGGSGTGGTARLGADAAGKTVTVAGSVNLNAQGFGGNGFAAGTGQGGNAMVAASGSSTVTITAGNSEDSVFIGASGRGGSVDVVGGDSGAGIGGIAQINVFGGASLTITAPDTFLEADGEGGDSLSLTGNGGAGNAGRAILSVDGGSATFNGNLSLSGDSVGGDGINGGTAFGNPENNNSRAFVFARNGSLAVTGLTSLHAVALGGQGSLSGNGGNATGGFANLLAANGVNTTGLGIITLGGLEIDSGAQGGSATGTGNGGSAGAGRAHLFVNGGAITVGGDASLFGDAIGGAGVNGGNAISARPFRQPRALIGSFNGTITVAGATVLDSSASGGAGSAGGAGGIAFAGVAAVEAQSNNGPSAINLADLLIAASAAGGFGGAGGPGQAGGAGGDAYGGIAAALGNAGQGDLTVSGDTIISVSATGGFGGLGGSGGTAPGAAGGAGGRAFGGALTVGTASGVDTPSNTGSATFGQVGGDANALGGAGGAGGLGTTQGAGGAGGSGFGGSAGLLARGSPATFTNVSLSANGIGGDGGKGSVQGDGGDGYAGDGFVIATQRFMRTERGTLDAGNVTITSAGIGGAGATTGDSFYSAATGAESEFFIRQSNVTLANLVLTTSGALAPNFTTTILSVVDPVVSGIPVPISVTVAAEPFDLAMADSTASIAGAFTLSTPGNMRVSLANSTLNVGSLALSAGNFVLPATRPVTLGTINVSSGLVLSSQLDFLAYANFDVAGSGFFDFGGSVLTGDLTFDGDLDINADGSITTGAITTGESIKLDALGAITTGQLTAGGRIGAFSDGPMSVAGASAGIVNRSSNPEATFEISLSSTQSSLTAGDLTAFGSVFVTAPGTVAVGNVRSGSAGLGFLALAGTGLTTGSIDTAASPGAGQIYLANHSMLALAGGGMDPTPILAATPVAIGGPITIGGAVSTGRFQAATTGAFTAQAITAPNLFQLAAGAAVTLGDLTSFTINVSSALSLTLGAVTSTATSAQLAALNQTNGVTLTAANGALATGAISSNGSIDLIGALALTTGAVNVSGGSVEMDTNGALLTGAITSGQSQRLFAGTTATTGNLVAGNNANSQFSVGVAAGGAVSIGNVTATRDIGLLSQNSSVTAGNIGTATNLGVLTRGAVTLGSVTTGTAANNFLYIANASLAPLGGALGPNFNPAPIFAATPIATTGPITIRGPINTGNLISATTGTLTIGSTAPTNLTLAGRLNLNAGGALSLGDVTATDIRLDSGSTVTGGALTARNEIAVSGIGAVTLGNLSAGIVNPTTSGDRDIGVASTGSSLTVGNVAAGTDVGFAAGGGNLTVGTIMAGDDVLLLARDAVSVGSITAGAADGRILIANASLRSLGDVVNDVDPDPIFNAAAAPVTGAITIGGPVTGTTFSAAANGNFTAPSLTLGQRISIARAALAQVDGAWVAPTIGIASQKLQFGTATGAGIGGTGTTSLTLRALASGQQAVFGGTTQGSGYTLTQSDFARIRTSNLTLQVDAQGVTSTTPDLEIRDLTLTGSAGSGSSAVAITTPGSLRVVGDLLLSQAGAMDTLAVTANRRLELVLPDGSIAITGAAGALAGTLTLSSDNLVAGTLTLLQQIMADPEAAGLADALKTPASTTSNLSGYIRASGVKLLSNANILLQNSGTARDFAGVTVGGGGLIIGRITPATGGTTGGTTGGGTTTTSGFSFTGMLVTANDILMFEFRVDAASTVTLRTYSYAGGTNQAGQAIPAGGFDPILALFDAAGALIGQNDDGGSANVPADPTTGNFYDTFLRRDLTPGNYTVSVSVFSNFAIGPNLSNGFEMNETDFGSGRTANFAFDVLGASTATGPGSQAPSGPLNVIGFGRQTDASGQTVSGDNFFATIDFGTGSEGTVEYNDISQFNTCFVNAGCQGPSMPDADPVAAISSEITVITGSVLDDSPVAPTADDSDEGDESGSNEPEDEDNADDEGSSPIAPPTPLISTRALDGDVTVVEPVSGAGNPALFGSAVNETTVEGETP